MKTLVLQSISLLPWTPMGSHVLLENPNPHQPMILTWTIYDVATGKVCYRTSKRAPPGTWFPDITLDPCSKYTQHKQPSNYGPLFYVCSGYHIKGRLNACGGPWWLLSDLELWLHGAVALAPRNYKGLQHGKPGKMPLLCLAQPQHCCYHWSLHLPYL